MSAAPVEGFEVEDLDAAALLELAGVNEREIRAREALRLRLAYQWAVLHPAEAAPVLGVLGPEELLGADGTPAVAAFTPEPFALELDICPAAGAQLVADALDLRHRLPLLWKRVQRLDVPAWQGRRVARQTHRLPLAGARWVDEQLAARTDGACGPVITDRLVAAAAAEHDPETHEEREDDARAGWDVKLTHQDPTGFTGSSYLTVDGDTLTLTEFHDLVCAVAHQLHVDGDSSPLGVRKVKAIRVITRAAQGHATLETTTTHGPGGGKIKIYLRVDAADLDLDHHDGSALATGEVERLGAATLTRIRDWVGHHQVVVTPVLNLHRRDRARRPRTTSPPCADDTTAPRPADAGSTGARAKAMTPGTARTARRTSSPRAAPAAPDRRLSPPGSEPTDVDARSHERSHPKVGCSGVR